MKTIWQKPYRGPFGKKEAEGLAEGLKEIAKPEVNLIYDAKIRQRPRTKMYDVYIRTEKVEIINQSNQKS